MHIFNYFCTSILSLNSEMEKEMLECSVFFPFEIKRVIIFIQTQEIIHVPGSMFFFLAFNNWYLYIGVRLSRSNFRFPMRAKYNNRFLILLFLNSSLLNLWNVLKVTFKKIIIKEKSKKRKKKSIFLPSKNPSV